MLRVTTNQNSNPVGGATANNFVPYGGHEVLANLVTSVKLCLPSWQRR